MLGGCNVILYCCDSNERIWTKCLCLLLGNHNEMDPAFLARSISLLAVVFEHR